MMEDKIGLDKFCDLLSKINMDFTDFILEDWESEEEGNVKLNGLTEKEWMNIYKKFLEKRSNWKYLLKTFMLTTIIIYRS